MSAGFWDFCEEEDIQGAYGVVDNMAFGFQEYTPPPQYQNPAPQLSESVTTLDEIKELFSNGFLETARAMQELKEEIAATGIALVSKLTALDTRIGIVEEQLQEIEVIERQQETLPMCTIVEDETDRIDSELAVTGAESAEEINLQPLPERANTLELKLSNDPGVYSRNFWTSNLLKQSLTFDHKSRRFLINDRGTPAGIPRTGPDIPSFHEFDQSQFLRFAGEGGCISYCDVIGSVTRPPEALLNVLVPC